MRCTDFLRVYSDYRDGLLSDPGLAYAAERHLRECVRCARHDRAVSCGVSVLRAAPEIEPSRSFNRQLRWRLRAAAPLGPFPATGRLAASVLVAAGLALVVLEGITVVSDTEAPREPLAQVVVNPGPPFVGFAEPGPVTVTPVSLTEADDADSAPRTAAVAP